MAEPGRTSRARRGVAALAGAVAVAASLTQVVGTMAAPVAVRTATLPISTANYFPTPLPAWISCFHDTSPFGYSLVEISWGSAGPGMKYHVRVWRGDNSSNIVHSSFTTGTTFRYRGESTAVSDRVAISTVNIASGGTDETRVRSSGAVSHTVYVVSRLTTRCSGEPRYDMPNQPWENQEAWTPPATGFTAAPAPLRMLIALAEEGETDVLAEPMPTDAPVGELADATPITTPTTEGSPEPTSPLEPGTTISSVIPPPTSGGESPASGETTTTGSPGSTPAPDEGPAGTSTSAVSSAPSAGIGDGPISIGTAEARLDEVDGEPQVIVSAGGVQVCTVTVPGATTIEESGGSVKVTGDGRERYVDIDDCEIA